MVTRCVDESVLFIWSAQMLARLLASFHVLASNLLEEPDASVGTKGIAEVMDLNPVSGLSMEWKERQCKEEEWGGGETEAQ